LTGHKRVADHRPASVLAFLCSGFPEGLRGETRDCGVRTAGARCCAANRGSVNRWVNRGVARPSLSLSRGCPTAPARPSLSLPPRERTCSRRSGEPPAPCVSPLHRGEQEGSSPSQERTCSRRSGEPPAPCVSPPKAFGGDQERSSDAKRASVKGARPVIDPPRKVKAALLRSLSWCLPSARHHRDASPHPHERSPRYSAGEILQPLFPPAADPSAALRRRPTPLLWNPDERSDFGG